MSVKRSALSVERSAPRGSSQCFRPAGWFVLALLAAQPLAALDRPGITFQVFQFPPDKIPRVDGDASGGTLIAKGHTEFWVTAFDYAGPEGPPRAVESVFAENKIIGLGFAVIDYDDVNARGNNGFWNLSRHHTMYGHAAELCAFRLMPIEPPFVPAFEAQWSFKVVDLDRRLVAFKDLSVGKIAAWKWDFGDGGTSTEQNPVHAYRKPGNLVVVLEVTGADGATSRRSKVWDVQLK